MTLSDLCRSIKRYWYVVVASMVLVALAAGVVSVVKGGRTSETQVTAEATIYANNGWMLIAGIADSVAQPYNEDSSVTVAVAYDANRSCVDVEVRGTDAQACLNAASYVANEAVAQAYEYFPTEVEGDIQYNGLPFVAQVQDPMVVEEVAARSGKSLLKAAGLGAFVGLLLGVCVVVALQLKQRKVLSVKAAEEVTGLPALNGRAESLDGEWLLANIRFAAKDNALTSVCVVPAGDASGEEAVARALEAAIASEREADSLGAASLGAIEVLVCRPISQSVESVYTAQRSDAVVVAVSQGVDTVPGLHETVEELQFASAPVVGLAVSTR
ncbi:hypothetical protein [uncultured Adlercreutzia sp.]|uniref:hypothetical protein n=1 Tax=uncultured Adlercreutzia sp. TaxID=875803 RepID=UPI0026F3CBD4|nr:hypothetical protein [uncultured Adlercreutzia sp.]